MIAHSLNNGQLSDKGVEGGDSLRTLEGLRRRLIAERQVSKLAKERAEILGSKLMELEKEMKMEIEMREKAEKKLQFFMNKLRSLNLSTKSDSSCSKMVCPEALAGQDSGKDSVDWLTN